MSSEYSVTNIRFINRGYASEDASARTAKRKQAINKEMLANTRLKKRTDTACPSSFHLKIHINLSQSISLTDQQMPFHVWPHPLPSHAQCHGLHPGLRLSRVLQGLSCLP